MAVKQTAGRDQLGDFAPEFAQLNDDVLFGEVWSREDKLSLRDRSLVTVIALMAQYDTVFVGFPVWWYQAPRIIETFLESYDFAGKTVVPFATSGGSPLGKTESILKKLCPPETKWLPGKRLSSRESAPSVQKWISSLGL